MWQSNGALGQALQLGMQMGQVQPVSNPDWDPFLGDFGQEDRSEYNMGRVWIHLFPTRT